MKTAGPSGRPQPLWFINHLVYVHVDGDTSGGALALLDERGRRGNMPPLHVHRRDDETFYVLEGELTLFVAGEQIVLGPGQAGARSTRPSWVRPPPRPALRSSALLAPCRPDRREPGDSCATPRRRSRKTRPLKGSGEVASNKPGASRSTGAASLPGPESTGLAAPKQALTLRPTGLRARARASRQRHRSVGEVVVSIWAPAHRREPGVRRGRTGSDDAPASAGQQLSGSANESTHGGSRLSVGRLARVDEPGRESRIGRISSALPMTRTGCGQCATMPTCL